MHFRKSIFEAKKDDLKNFSYSDLDKKYKEYLEKVVDEKSIRNAHKSHDLFINASIGSNNLLLDYYGPDFNNHNTK